MKPIDAEMEERILTFAESMFTGNTDFLNQIEKEALGDGVPIIRTQTQSLLRFLLELKHPSSILEVGTATGFSACLLRTYAPKEASITTIEKDPERARKARENFAGLKKAVEDGQTDRGITLLEGDAADILPKLEGPYDFIFMDAAKGQYIHFLPDVLRLLSRGGILVSDNILKDGEVLESRFAVKRRDRTIHKRMREYLLALAHNPELQTLLLQEGDGAALCVRR